jgi:hypothetical protein
LEAVLPFAFYKYVSFEAAFVFHSRFLHDARRCGVLRTADCRNAVEFKFFKSEIDQCFGGFGGVTVTPIFAVEDVADFSSFVFCVPDCDSARADQFSFFFQDDAEFKVFSGLLFLAFQNFCEKIPRLLGGVRAEMRVADNPRIRRVLMNVPKVILIEIAQDETFCFYCDHNFLVPPEGIEPSFLVPKTSALSIKLRRHRRGFASPILYTKKPLQCGGFGGIDAVLFFSFFRVPVPVYKQRSGHEDGGVGPRNYAHEQRQNEEPYAFGAEDHKCKEGQCD